MLVLQKCRHAAHGGARLLARVLGAPFRRSHFSDHFRTHRVRAVAFVKLRPVLLQILAPGRVVCRGVPRHLFDSLQVRRAVVGRSKMLRRVPQRFRLHLRFRLALNDVLDR